MSDFPNVEILGRGIKFPFEIGNTGQGKTGLVMSEGKQKVYESIKNILTTPIGSRFFRRDFGSRIHELVFEPQNEGLLTLLKYFVADAIEKWEKRVRLLTTETRFKQREGEVIVYIRVWFISEQVEGNMVFPFYLDEFKRLKGVQ